MEIHNLILPDGRNLEVVTSGTPSSSAILFHHGTPGSYKTWDKWLPSITDEGGFVITFSRAGYGMSSRNTGRTVIRNSEDTQAILEHFGVNRFVSIGASGGGPHALADTTLVQNVAVISIAGVAEYGSTDLDYLEGMGEENKVEFAAAIAGEEALESWMIENMSGFGEVTGEQLLEALGGLISEADKKAVTLDVATTAAGGFRHGMVNGYYGIMDDDIAFVGAWGFDISQIKKPVEIWQGDQDLMVPLSHGQWLASKIPSATLHFETGEGHISLGINKRKEIVKNAMGYLQA
jgi:pimeloyl-ACP methyl ester carboxylesterase